MSTILQYDRLKSGHRFLQYHFRVVVSHAVLQTMWHINELDRFMPILDFHMIFAHDDQCYKVLNLSGIKFVDRCQFASVDYYLL